MDCNKFGINFFILFVINILTSKTDTCSCLEAHENDTIANRIFPIKLFSSISNEKDYFNLLVSPSAIRYSLLAAAFVADGSTKADLEKLLFGTTYNNLLQNIKLLKNAQGWTVRIFVNEKYNVNSALDKLASEFKEFIDYSNADVSSNIINKWVKNMSKNTVPQITLSKFHKKNEVFLTLAHVEHFESTWVKPFKSIYPKGDNSTGQVFKVNMLHQENVFLYGNLTDLGVIATELPLNKNATMLILQPINYTTNFQYLKGLLKTFDIRNISSRLEETEISIYFPILKSIKMERSMTETINRAYGVTKPFLPNFADFHKMHGCGHKTYIRYFNQRSRIHVDTKEVRVGSATGLQWSYPINVSTVISGEDDEDEEEYEQEDEDDSDEEFYGRINIQPKKILPKVILVRPFFYAIIKEGTPVWLGTIYKPHNWDRRS